MNEAARGRCSSCSSNPEQRSAPEWTTALLDQERQLERLIAGKAEQQMRLLSGETYSRRSLRHREGVGRDSPRNWSRSRAGFGKPVHNMPRLTQPAPLTLREIQAKVLDEGTSCWNTPWEREKSFLWAVTPSSIDSFELPPRAEIESGAKRLYEILTARNQRRPRRKHLTRELARVGRSERGVFRCCGKSERDTLGSGGFAI